MEDRNVHFENVTETPSYYSWEIAGKGVSVLLAFDVVDRLLAETLRGFGAVPRRGAEVGGVLLGTGVLSDRLVVKIEDYVPVPVSYSRGPSYLLSASDRRSFQETVNRWQPCDERDIYAVGFFRSNTREGLGLTPEDLDLFNEFFENPTDVALLIKPFVTKPCQAGFFFREANGMRSESSYLEFPFRRKDLGGGVAPRPSREESAAGEKTAVGEERPIPERATPEKPLFGAFTPEPRKRKANFWIPLSFIFLIIGVLLGFQSGLVTARTKVATQPAEDPYVLDLTAKKESDAVHLKWNRQAPALNKAQRGILTITDGEHNTNIALEPGDMRSGSLVYRNITDSVKFRLEVFTTGRNSLSETVEFKKE